MMRSKTLYLVIIFFCIFSACNSNDKETRRLHFEVNTIEKIKRQIKLHPDSLMLKSNLIEAYRNEGYYDSAISIADQELKKDSGSAYLWNIKASLYFENNDTLNAINSLQHAINIYPLPDYLVALGTVYAEIKNKNSLAIADNLLRTNKTKSGKDAYFIKGLYYNYMNEPQKAISYMDSALNLDFTYMYAYREKAIALYNEMKYQDAIKVLERAVTIQNNFDEGYFWLGKCYEKLNKKDQAIQNYQNALLYDKNYAEAREALDRIERSSK
ncbi:MAG TPA: tetratricopeptide repeat protein [Hanamia sp.]|jgi:tetratricopeptide (TPR) repeat protein|nr:tetratricopeptide repeat protein [Hanamia sp.]